MSFRSKLEAPTLPACAVSPVSPVSPVWAVWAASAALLLAALGASPAHAAGAPGATGVHSGTGQALTRQPGWAAGIRVEPLAIDELAVGRAEPDAAGLRWGPRRQPGDGLAGAAPYALGGTGLYAHVDLAAALPGLPARWHRAIGRPDGGVTVELRPASSPLAGLGLGSMLRWQLRDGAQMALRLRGGRLSLQYGLSFSL